jgi:hypothetical protein
MKDSRIEARVDSETHAELVDMARRLTVPVSSVVRMLVRGSTGDTRRSLSVWSGLQIWAKRLMR